VRDVPVYWDHHEVVPWSWYSFVYGRIDIGRCLCRALTNRILTTPPSLPAEQHTTPHSCQFLYHSTLIVTTQIISYLCNIPYKYLLPHFSNKKGLNLKVSMIQFSPVLNDLDSVTLSCPLVLDLIDLELCLWPSLLMTLIIFGIMTFGYVSLSQWPWLTTLIWCRISSDNLLFPVNGTSVLWITAFPVYNW
jgi:hypothetical protein